MALFGLALLCVISTFGAVRASTRQHQLNAPLVFASLTSFGGIAMPSLWRWCRTTVGSGYLGMLSNSAWQDDQFRVVLITLAVGPFAAGVLFWLAGSVRHAPSTSGRIDRLINVRQSARGLDAALVGCLALFLAGQGSSIVARATYLDSSGIPMFTRASGVGNLVAVALIYATLRLRKLGLAEVFTACVAGAYIVLTAAAASRTAGLLFLSVIAALTSRRRANGRPIALLIVLGGAGTLFLFELVLQSRHKHHGLLHLVSNVADALVSLANWTEVQRVFALVLASLLVTVVVIPRSIGTVSPELILANMNPMVGLGSDAFSYSTQGAERLYPYIWTPLSTAGQAYGALGPVWIVGLLFILSVLVQFASMRPARSSWLHILQTAVRGLYLLQLLYALEYSTRQWSRIFSVTVTLALGVIIGNQRERHADWTRHDSIPVGHPAKSAGLDTTTKLGSVVRPSSVKRGTAQVTVRPSDRP